MFNRLTDHVLKEVDPAWFLKVMDDLVIFGQTKDECFMRFERILKLLENIGYVVMSLKKLQEGDCMKWCRYILRVIDAEEPILIEPDTEELRAVTEFPTPRNRTELRRFLRLKMQIWA